MLTKEEMDWKNYGGLTEIQKEFLYGMDWVREEIVDNALLLWRDNNRTGFETVDKMMGEIIDDLTEFLKGYIGMGMEDVITSMLDDNAGSHG